VGIVQKVRNATVIYDGQGRKKKAAIYAHKSKTYVRSTIASAYNTVLIDGKEYTEIGCIGKGTDNEYWKVGVKCG
jgi:hypothetical protein